jgi:hypothetical protein
VVDGVKVGWDIAGSLLEWLEWKVSWGNRIKIYVKNILGIFRIEFDVFLFYINHIS